jgi:hypothetical protein
LIRAMPDLPAPSAQALAHSGRLAGLIRREILDNGGAIPFSRYMERCLYSPGYGYYSAGSQKFGAAGDFVTAPEISTLFGRCLAGACYGVLEQLGNGDILEFGAGIAALFSNPAFCSAMRECGNDACLMQLLTHRDAQQKTA